MQVSVGLWFGRRGSGVAAVGAWRCRLDHQWPIRSRLWATGAGRQRPETGSRGRPCPGRASSVTVSSPSRGKIFAALQSTEPLARVVIDAHIDQWADRLEQAEGQLGVMRSAATRIARMLPPETVETILCITGRRPVATLDSGRHQRPTTCPSRAHPRSAPSRGRSHRAHRAPRRWQPLAVNAEPADWVLGQRKRPANQRSITII